MTLTPLALMGLGVPELVIILVVVLLLFGGTRLAGLGKSSGRALKEFKEETKGLREGDKPAAGAPTTAPPTAAAPPRQVTGGQPSAQSWPQTPPENLADPSAPSANDIRRDV